MNDGNIINRRTFLEAAGAFSLLSAMAGSAAADRTERRNELLVGVAPSAAGVRRTAERALPAEARIVHENARLGYVTVELPARASATAKAAVTKAIENRRGIEYVEPNAIHEALYIPDDPRFDEQYAPRMVNAPAAWEHTLGDRDVTVAIVDTGIEYDHPDLDGNVGSDVGYDFVDGDDDPSPGAREEHHGTHVAGIAAAEIDNGTGISGLANATLLGVRALNENGWGYTSNIADGIQWATDHGVDIINLSLGGGGYTETIQKAVSYANGKDVVIVAAAGNDYGGPVLYPAAYEECIAVSALDADGTLAAYSNMGPEVELCAPGTSVLSTWPDGGYERLSGTSMATPVVSGVAALVRSQESLSNEEMRARLKDTAVDVGLSAEEQGSGRVDAAAAITNRVSQTLTFVGSGSKAEYTIAASEALEKSTANGASINPSDNRWRTTASGYVIGGRDSYALSGDIVALQVDGDAAVYLNGERVNPGNFPDHVLTIEGTGPRTDYVFSVSSDLEKSTANNGSIGPSDSISRDTVNGWVGGGIDSYTFSGEVLALGMDGNASVSLDGTAIDPADYPENVLTLVGTGSRTDYVLTVGRDLKKSTANNGSIGPSDSVSGDTVDGWVSTGVDSYTFSGGLESFSLDGDAAVYLNGEQVNPEKFSGHVLTIEGTGPRTDYVFSVSSDIEKSTANGGTLGPSDSISGTTVTGWVGGGIDSYTFSGDLESFSLDGEAAVYLNDERVNPGNFPDHVLTIEGTGPRTDYVFTVTDDLEKSTANGGSIGPSDSVSGNTVHGWVGGGIDSYTFSGDLEAFSLDGKANISLDGKPAHIGQQPDHVFTIEGTGPRTDYVFSVGDDLEKSTANNGSIGPSDSISRDTVNGWVGGGIDSYTFSGEVLALGLDGAASVSLDGERVDPGKYPENVITLVGTGSRTDYTLTVGRDLEKSTANGASIGPSDSVSGNTVNGWVGGGIDSYIFSGEIESLGVDGDATVFLNGEQYEASGSLMSGIYSGLSDADFDTIDRMEEWQGAPYAVQNLFVPWNSDGGHMNWLFGHILPKIWASGRVPLITWEPFTPGAQAAAVNTAALVESGEYEAYLHGLADTTPNDIEVRIANGEYDRYIDSWASRLKEWLAGPDGRLGTADDRQAYIRLAHEMNGDWYPWSPTVGNSSPGSYVRMWRRVHRRFERMGIRGDSTKWMWCVNADDVGPYSAEQLYPGDAYVDWLSIDGYQWGESMNWSHWESPESIFSNMLSRVRNIADKPVCIAETASTSETRWGYDPERKDEWIRDAFAYFENAVEMWCWFNEDKETDWAMFDGVRGTERVAYHGELVNAYAAYRKAVDSSAVTANAAESAPIPQERQRGFLGRGS